MHTHTLLLLGFEACECYEKAAELCVKLQEPNEAAYHYVTASKCLCVGDDKNEAHAQGNSLFL